MASAKEMRKRQIINFCVGATLFFLAFQLFVLWVKKADDPLKVNNTSKIFRWPTSTDVDLREHYFHILENENKSLKDEIKKAAEEMKTQRKMMDDLGKKIDLNNSKQAFNMLEQYKQNKQQANDPFGNTTGNETLSNVINNKAFPSTEHTGSGYQNLPNTNQTVANAELSNNSIQAITGKKLNLTKPTNMHSADSYIPAGSFVQAHVIGGMMASAGIESQGDPRPVLLRITDLTQIPNRVRRSIKDCHVVAAGIGDISSQRAYVRAESLSCTLNDGKIFEEKIDGYLAGGDSMTGVQGQVIRNEKEMITNAFWAGMVRGGGKAVAGTLGSTATSPLGSVKTMGRKDVLPSMISEGMSDASDTLENYFIQLAKQHHPVIELTPGQEVSIVFLKGLSFSGVVR